MAIVNTSFFKYVHLYKSLIDELDEKMQLPQREDRLLQHQTSTRETKAFGRVHSLERVPLTTKCYYSMCLRFSFKKCLHC